MFLLMGPILLSFVLMGLYGALASKEKKCSEKCSPYECGFEPFSKIRTSFSVRFFLMAILFVIFDVEICIISPIIFCLIYEKSVYSVFSFLFFMLILFYGLAHEFREGSLEWVY